MMEKFSIAMTREQMELVRSWAQTCLDNFGLNMEMSAFNGIQDIISQIDDHFEEDARCCSTNRNSK